MKTSVIRYALILILSRRANSGVDVTMGVSDARK